MSHIYEIVVFTAGSEAYAKEVMKVLDPSNTFVRKIVSNESCFLSKEGYMVKDLRIFADRFAENILIGDNSIESFACQLCNGIPIQTYTGDEDDLELEYLSQYLIGLSSEPHIVEANAKSLWQFVKLEEIQSETALLHPQQLFSSSVLSIIYFAQKI
eukprot:TRINITY_DN5605_c0_g1_i2.p1 TRINITY_DN5605_c0_g1~~TRINITY_DN5605_c0_g1_i2.p1  ORF type:complete len:157 (-),score=22.24 TRINITY_DN5605_c0_g1_i2:21-491(-)